MSSETGRSRELKSKPAPGPRLLWFWLIPAIIGLAVGFVFRTPGYDLQQVHPELRSLQEPCAQARASYFFDGGSIGLEIVDGAGRNLKLALPIESTRKGIHSYPRLFLGGVYSSKPGAVEVPCTDDSRRFIAHLIDRYAERGADRDHCLYHLRGAPFGPDQNLVAGSHPRLVEYVKIARRFQSRKPATVRAAWSKCWKRAALA